MFGFYCGFEIIRKMDVSQSEERMEIWKYLICANQIGVQYWMKKRYFVLEAHHLRNLKYVPTSNNQAWRIMVTTKSRAILTKVISEMSKIKGELRSLNNELISLRDDHKRFEDHTRESLHYIMNGLKRVEVLSEYASVDGSGKKYDGSVDNLHKKRNSCFAKGISIENKRARSDFPIDFCAKGEMSSGLKNNPKGEATRGVKVTTASVTRVGTSSEMKKSSNGFDKPVVFDKSGSWPKVSYKCGPYHLTKPLIDVDQAVVLE